MSRWIQTIQTTGKERPAWTLVLVAFLHIAWGIGLLFGSSPQSVPIFGLLKALGGPLAVSLTLLLSSALVLFARISKEVAPRFLIALSIPQQLLITISALTALVAVWSGQYPDGVVRARFFIFTDQLPIVSIAAVHSFALLEYAVGVFRHMWGVPKEAITHMDTLSSRESEVRQITLDMALLQLKAGVWGAGGGLITVIAAYFLKKVFG